MLVFREAQPRDRRPQRTAMRESGGPAGVTARGGNTRGRHLHRMPIIWGNDGRME
jgi:hypothetical protein